MNYELRIAARNEETVGVLAICLPDDWKVCERAASSLRIESTDGSKACYLFLQSLPAGRDEEEAFNFARTTERKSLKSMPDRHWSCLIDELSTAKNVRISILDHLDVPGLYRIVDKLIVGHRFLARGSYHDYDCSDLAVSTAYFSNLIESLDLRVDALQPSETRMNLNVLRRRAADNSLEVEHLLEAGCLRLPGLKSELEQMAAQHEWSMDAERPDGSFEVPFGRWARVVGEYAESGFAALRPLARDDEDASFVLALLQEMNSTEAIDQLFTLFADVFDDPQRQPVIVRDVVKTINFLFSVKSSPDATRDQRLRAADFLNKLLPTTLNNSDRASLLYALRGTGNGASLKALADIEDTLPPNAGALQLAVRSIKKRLKTES